MSDRIDDERLMAWLDGELGPVEAERVERLLAEDPELARRLDVQRALRARLAAHYGPIADEPVPERFQAMLEPRVVALDTARARRGRPAWQSLAALAATLVLGLFVGRALPGDEPVTFGDGVLIARGALADTLENGLASTQPADAATRIGVSFAAADGRYCRTFESGAVAGLACRGDSGWQLMMTSAATPSSADYRQAGATVAIMQAAQEMMAGEPLDAAAEARARNAGWRRR